MAVQAILAHRRMLEEKRAALFGMTAIANLIHTVGLQQRRGRGAMRIVAIHTAQLALQERHMRALVEFGALNFMAGKAGLVDGLARRQTMSGEIRHRIVAVAAGQLVGLVNGAMPEDALTALVTGEALSILQRYRGFAFVGKADDGCKV